MMLTFSLMLVYFNWLLLNVFCSQSELCSRKFNSTSWITVSGDLCSPLAPPAASTSTHRVFSQTLHRPRPPRSRRRRLVAVDGSASPAAASWRSCRGNKKTSRSATKTRANVRPNANERNSPVEEDFIHRDLTLFFRQKLLAVHWQRQKMFTSLN